MADGWRPQAEPQQCGTFSSFPTFFQRLMNDPSILIGCPGPTSRTQTHTSSELVSPDPPDANASRGGDAAQGEEPIDTSFLPALAAECQAEQDEAREWQAALAAEQAASTPARPAATPTLPEGQPPWLSEAVSLEILSAQPMDRGGGHEDVPVLIRVKPPSSAERVPCSLCCILDISGSMGVEALITGASGEHERHGLSLLDVAKHGVRTIINTLDDHDQLAIVTFNHAAATVLGLTVMDEAGRKLAETHLDALRSGGGTNLWSGLFQGLEALRTHNLPGSLAHIMLLTDGESNQREVIMPNLVAYKAQYERLPCTINTFGFGYQIDSGLLVKLASAGDGSYAFIPDAGFIGTVFVNCMSNLLVTFARELRLALEPEEGAEILEVIGGYEVQEQSWGLSVKLGMLQYQQSRDVVLRMRTKGDGAFLFASGQHEPLNRQGASVVEVKAPEGAGQVNETEVLVNLLRSRFVDAISETVATAMYTTPKSKSKELELAASGVHANGTDTSKKSNTSGVLKKALSRLSNASRNSTTSGQSNMTDASAGSQRPPGMAAHKEIIEDFISGLKASKVSEEQCVKAFLEDAAGQTSEAVSTEQYYTKWGRHYLPSLMFAHKLQQCNNFKDPGVQSYGGDLFQNLRDKADDIFCQLPPPKPSASYVMRTASGTSVAGSAPAAPVSMAAYNDRFAGCIDGSCLATLASGSVRRVSELRKGDEVLTLGDGKAVVECVVRSQCLGVAPLVTLASQEGGSVRLTPHHPVLIDGCWAFPHALAEPEDLPCEAVYSFLLNRGSALMVGGIPCTVLGHGLEVGAAAHPYFASRRKLEKDLRCFSGFSEGLVDLTPGCVYRDPETGLVCRLRPAKDFGTFSA